MDSAKMGTLSSTWELLAQFWKHFSRISAHELESKNIKKTSGFYSWGLSWKMLARRLRFSAQFWTRWRQDSEQEGKDGDYERQDGDQERQDEPT